MPITQINGFPCFYQDYGHGTPLVFIHGAFADHTMWLPQLKRFRRQYRVITYDVRGHGNTGPTDEREYNMALLADDLRHLLDSLGVERAVICGLSMGGIVAQQFALANPERVSRLVLCATLASSQINPRQKTIADHLAYNWIQTVCRQWITTKHFASGFSLILRPFTSHIQADIRSKVRDHIERQVSKMSQEEFTKLMQAFFDFKLLPIEQLQMPTLVLVGENENWAFHRHLKVFEEKIPNVQSVVLPGVGHILNIEACEQFNQYLGNFITQ